MEFKKITGNRYRLVGGNNLILTEEEKLKMEQGELVLQDITSNKCQKETTKKIKKIKKELKDLETTIKPVEETTETA